MIQMQELTFEQITQAAFGCESVQIADSAAVFHRLPDELEAFYRREEGSRIRLESPSGVRLRFRTATKRVGIALRYGQAARPFYRGVLTVDGAVADTFGAEEPAEAWEGVITLEASSGPRLLELWLPHLVRTDVVRLEVDDVSDVVFDPPPEFRWLALGDSITQGMTTPLPTEMWAVRVANRLGADLKNYGIGGARMEKILADAELKWPYDLLTIAYGANDFNTGFDPQEANANAARLLSRQAEKHPGAKLVLITPTPAMGLPEVNSVGLSLDDYRRALADAADGASGCMLVNGEELLPAEARYFVDGVHPNTEGMALYAENLLSAIEPIL